MFSTKHKGEGLKRNLWREELVASSEAQGNAFTTVTPKSRHLDHVRKACWWRREKRKMTDIFT